MVAPGIQSAPAEDTIVVDDSSDDDNSPADNNPPVIGIPVSREYVHAMIKNIMTGKNVRLTSATAGRRIGVVAASTLVLTCAASVYTGRIWLVLTAPFVYGVGVIYSRFQRPVPLFDYFMSLGDKDRVSFMKIAIAELMRHGSHCCALNSACLMFGRELTDHSLEA